MIAGTYILSGVLLAISAVLFNAGALNAVTQTACWCVIFFFASAGASSAYLTVSEIFPVEVRAKAIAVFFAIAQSFGAFGPWLYGELIGNGQDHFKLFIGYLIGAGVMVIGGRRCCLPRHRRRTEVARGHRPAALGHPTVGAPLGGDEPSTGTCTTCRHEPAHLLGDGSWRSNACCVW